MKRALSNAALLFGSVLLFLLVLEAAARLAARWTGGGKERGDIALYTEHDPLLGWRKRPYGRAVFHRKEYTVEVVINSHGLRDPERAYASPGTFRVLALGDSFVEAYGVPLDQTVTQCLERSLQRSGLRAEVLNGGTAAYSTDQEYLFYKTEGVRYSPQVVVVFFYYNDVLYNARDDYHHAPKPVFDLVDGRLVLRGTPVPPPPASSPGAEVRPSPEGAAALAWLQDRLWYGAPKAYNVLARTGIWPPIQPHHPPMQLKVYKRKPVAEIEDAWERTAAIIEALGREVRAHGAQLVLAYVPSRMEVSERDWDLTRLQYGMDDEHWDRGKVLSRLVQIGQGAGLRVLDLTRALRREEGFRRGPYYVYDGHWNALGHRAVARELEAYLRGQGLLPRGQVTTRASAIP